VPEGSVKKLLAPFRIFFRFLCPLKPSSLNIVSCWRFLAAGRQPAPLLGDVPFSRLPADDVASENGGPRYSFGRGGSTVHSSVAAAEDFLVFVDGVVRLFPEFAGRALIIAGESYGGHYIPAFAGSILDRNEAVAAGARTDVGTAISLAALYAVFGICSLC
jgi:hypothetical protein